MTQYGIHFVTMTWYLHYTLSTANSATVPVLFDAKWVDAWPKDPDMVSPLHDLDTGEWGSDSPVRNHMRRLILNRHWGSANVSFLDGHVESIKLERLWSLKWHRKFITFSGDKLRDNGDPIYKK